MCRDYWACVSLVNWYVLQTRMGGGGSDPEHRKHGIQVRNTARDTEDTS